MIINTSSFDCRSAALLFAASLSFVALPAAGQVVRRPAVGRNPAAVAQADRDAARIRKITGLGSRGKIRTPEFRVSSTRASVNPPGHWIQITTEYATKPEWIDELVFQYYVITETRDAGKKLYSLFRATVRYGDVERGTRHFSTVFLKPNTVKRFGEPIGMAVEISYKGNVVATDSDVKAGAGLPDGEWWKNPHVTDSDAVKTRSGYLLNRSETPFALIDIDDYETIR